MGKKKKKKKDKDKERDHSVEEGGEERKRRKKKHKHHREESEGREERRKHKHHHRRREEDGKVEETDRGIVGSHLEKRDDNVGNIIDIQKEATDDITDIKKDAIEENKVRRETKDFEEGSQGAELGILQLGPDHAVGTDVPSKERVEQNQIIATAPTLSDSPGIEKSSEHFLENANGVDKCEESLANPIESDMEVNHDDAMEQKIAYSEVSSFQADVMEEEEVEEEEDDEARRKEE